MKPATAIRAKMIAQLRATGSLSSAPRPATALSKKAVGKPAAQQVARVISAALNNRGACWFAPSTEQSVLP